MTTETILHKTLTSNESPPNDNPNPNSSFQIPNSSEARQRWLKMATESVDRAGDVLVMDGMDATNFQSNPQFLWQHGSSGALINTIGKVLDLQIANGALFALVEYDTSDLAEQIFELDTKGLLPANSIGFRPLEWHANDFGGNTFTKWELIECSKVELPMNPEAVDSGERRVESEIIVSAYDAAEWLTN
jgi:hypothetical protein